MEWSWNIGHFPERRIDIIKLNDVFVCGDGLVFDRALDVFGRTISQQIPEHIEHARAELERAIGSGSFKQTSGPAVLCVKPGWGNYGHWLMEMLPRASLADELLQNPTLKFIVPDTSGRLNEVIERSLKLIGIDEQKLIKYSPSPLWVEELTIVEGMTSHGGYMSPLVFAPLDRMANQVAASNLQRLYIRRKVPGYRHFVNEEEVCELLAGGGFTIISSEEHSFEAQISFFKGAKQILGVTSAALTSLCFCKPGTKVTMFYPESMADTFYWFIAQHRHLDFRDIRCKQAGPSKTHMPWDADLRLPLAELLEIADMDEPINSTRLRKSFRD